MPLLTEKEIAEAKKKSTFKKYKFNDYGNTVSDKEISIDQSRKDFNWLHDPCGNDKHKNWYARIKMECPECMNGWEKENR